jgi:hypothetical protein
MSVEPKVDHGQKMPRPAGRAIGFVDDKFQCDAVTKALSAAGFAESTVFVLHGEDGIQMLERSENDFFFGDAESDVIELGIKELQKGHFARRSTLHSCHQSDSRRSARPTRFLSSGRFERLAHQLEPLLESICAQRAALLGNRSRGCEMAPAGQRTRNGGSGSLAGPTDVPVTPRSFCGRSRQRNRR